MSQKIETALLERVRVVYDFPVKGIAFRDITTLLKDIPLSKAVLKELVQQVSPDTEVIAGIESRGFLFGMPMALELGLPFVPVRKKGKLPARTQSVKYNLEYGVAEIEIHDDALEQNVRVHIHDDFLATGGSALAAAALVRKCGAHVSGFSFLMGIDELGAEALLREESPNIAILARC